MCLSVVIVLRFHRATLKISAHQEWLESVAAFKKKARDQSPPHNELTVNRHRNPPHASATTTEHIKPQPPRPPPSKLPRQRKILKADSNHPARERTLRTPQNPRATTFSTESISLKSVPQITNAQHHFSAACEALDTGY